jgi:hypothetical protein
MAIYLITHGKRESGPDPVHTAEGLEQIEALPIPTDVCMIISGAGRRFLETMEIIHRKVPSALVKYSLFCGGPEGDRGADEIILTDGRVVRYADYIGIHNGPLDMWQFIASLSDRTLLCAGGALMLGLGLEAIYEKGHLYEVDPATRTGKLLA